MTPRTALIALSLVATNALAAPLIFEGEVPADGGDFFVIPFEVPEGTVEIEVRHDDLSSENILDWGLDDPNGFRGWGGGNTEPAVVGVSAASRSYLAGPIPAGTWKVIVGKAKVVSMPARYRVEVELRTAATLAPQPQRAPYQHVSPLVQQRRWYAGDFHVHSLESGDARPTLDEVATFARSRGLDFVALSDHNTRSQLDFIVDAQTRHPNLLLVPSVEFTTYDGHANAFGATEWVDHRFGLGDATLERALDEFAAQGAIFTINHPVIDLGELCIGCAWKHKIPSTGVGAVEIGIGGWDTTGVLFDEQAIAWWDRLLDRGMHLAAVGGSDDHRAGVSLGQTHSPIGAPTTMVLADELSVPALMQAVRDGRTVVKLRGPDDPMVELDAVNGERHGDTIVSTEDVTLRIIVTGGKGHQVGWVREGDAAGTLDVDADSYTVDRQVSPPLQGAERWRAEVLVDGRPRTITSHLWLSRTLPDGGTPGGSQGSSCGCSATSGVTAVLAIVSCLAAVALRRRRW